MIIDGSKNTVIDISNNINDISNNINDISNNIKLDIEFDDSNEKVILKRKPYVYTYTDNYKDKNIYVDEDIDKDIYENKDINIYNQKHVKFRKFINKQSNNMENSYNISRENSNKISKYKAAFRTHIRSKSLTNEKKEKFNYDSDTEKDSDEEIDEGVLKRMEETLQKIRNNQEFINCLLQIDAYREHNTLIKSDMKDRILILETKYAFYTGKLNAIQISIIVFSAVMTFIQGLSGFIYISEKLLNLISLVITVYTGLLLTISKYMKYEEKKESIHNLQQKFSEFIITIECRDDKLNTWSSDNFWAGHDVKLKQREWNDLEKELKKEFLPIIEKKQNLCYEFEKLIDIQTRESLQLYARRRAINYRKLKNKLDLREFRTKKQHNYIKNIIKDYEDNGKKTTINNYLRLKMI